MKKNSLFFQLLILVSLLCNLNLSAQKSDPKFQYYVLALSWQPSFCEKNAAKKIKECQIQTDKSFDANNFTIHGLWPSADLDLKNQIAYCGIDSSLIKMDIKHQWSDLPNNFVSPKVLQDIATYMPGNLSDLYKHEWFKHGVCTGLSGDAYFKLLLELEIQFANSKFNKFITSNIGKSISKIEVYKQFENEFGKGSSTALTISCVKIKGVNLLSEIKISLIKDLQPPKKIINLLLKGKFKSDNCPDSFIIDKAGLGNF